MFQAGLLRDGAVNGATVRWTTPAARRTLVVASRCMSSSRGIEHIKKATEPASLFLPRVSAMKLTEEQSPAMPATGLSGLAEGAPCRNSLELYEIFSHVLPKLLKPVASNGCGV